MTLLAEAANRCKSLMRLPRLRMGLARAQDRLVKMVSSPGEISPMMMKNPPRKTVMRVMALASSSIKG